MPHNDTLELKKDKTMIIQICKIHILHDSHVNIPHCILGSVGLWSDEVGLNIVSGSRATAYSAAAMVMCMLLSCVLSINQWEVQDPEMEVPWYPVPTIYQPYFFGLWFRGDSPNFYGVPWFIHGTVGPWGVLWSKHGDIFWDCDIWDPLRIANIWNHTRTMGVYSEELDW